MSYDVRVSGQITFNPALVPPAAGISTHSVKFTTGRNLGRFDSNPDHNMIVATGNEGGLNEEICDNVQALVDLVLSIHPHANFYGYLDLWGAEAGDWSRIYVRNGRAVVVEPEILWPADGDGDL